MASYDLGYEEERFATKVNRNFHCLICFNVLKDPVMCQRNQHCFCRGCITEHLCVNAQRCPTCAEGLTVDTLTDAPRMVKDYLSELPIYCDYQDRGCQEIVQLQNLRSHVEKCGFKPVVCANQGCGMTMNQRDQIHHESELCEHRKLQCHNCDEMSILMAGMQRDLAKLQANVANVETKVAKVDRNMENMQNMENNMANMEIGMNNMQLNMASLNMNLVPNMQTNIGKLHTNSEKNFETVKSEVKELRRTVTDEYESLKETLLEKIEGLEKKQEEITSDVRQLSSAKENQEGIIVAGGIGESSVEIYNASQRSWSLLQSMPGKRFQASSFVYKNHATIAGGYCSGMAVDDMIGMNIYPNPHPLTEWENFPTTLPNRLTGHSSVLFNDSLFVTGGWNDDVDEYSGCIHEVQLEPPYSVKLVAEMPERREGHCTELFNDNIYIFGGNQTGINEHKLRSVELFDTIKKECQQLKPLPYPVADMATVKWAENVVVIGGTDKHGKVLNTIVIYNTKTGQYHLLPPMKYRRKGCTAVVLGNTIVVMGGADGGENILKSVEGFSFDHYGWEELPQMNEARYGATAVVI